MFGKNKKSNTDIKRREKKEEGRNNIVEEGIELIEGSMDLVDDGIKIIKKKLSLFYKVNIFITLFVSMILFYFIILVPLNPKTVPYITKKVENYLRANFDNEATIENSYINFTPYGTLKITIVNLKLNKIDTSLENQELIMPKIESEFSILNLIFLNFIPKRIKIINSEIIFHTVDSKNLDQNEIKKQNFQDYIQPAIEIISAIKNSGFYIKNLEIENAKFTFKKQDNIDNEIFLKKSQIKFVAKTANIYSSNIITINQDKKEIQLDTNCAFSTEEAVRCGLLMDNFNINSIAHLSDSLKNLSQINANLKAVIDFSVLKRKLQNFNFKIQSAKGDFSLSEIFSKKIYFTNLNITGNYNYTLDMLDVAQIKANLKTDINKTEKDALDFAMSILISDLRNNKNNSSDFYIKLENLGGNDITSFWPLTLPNPEIRLWVAEHISSGNIKNAYTKFSFKTQNSVTHMEKIDARIFFSGLNLNYSNDFPAISNISGIANFSEKNMMINIDKGNVLASSITKSEVSIPDFSKPVLNIYTNIAGSAADSLTHVNYKSLEFTKMVEKYFNGPAESEVDVKIPLTDNIELKNVYIAINSLNKNIKNEYLDGEVLVKTKKNFSSNKFSTLIDLTKAKIYADIIDVKKEKNSQGSLDFVIDVSKNNEIYFKDIILQKKEEVIKNKKPQIVDAKITAEIKLQSDFTKITLFNVKNSNFGNNNYYLSYKDANNRKEFYFKGTNFNLSSFLENKPPFSLTNNNSPYSKISINLENILLKNKKSIKNFRLDLNCNIDGICYNGFLKANYSKQQNMNLNVEKKSRKKAYTISGNINDVGYLAEGMAISDKISAGNAKVNIAQNIVKGKVLYEGEININNDITFYENNATKRLEKNNLFSKVKDTIFSNNKTTFDSVKIEFSYKEKNLDIISMIANNYKIGITAKGFINFADNSFNIRGMIVPGFVINNLFGIGKIPLLGGVISGLLTGGEGGGLFGIKYEYAKLPNQTEPTFETYTMSAFVPVSIRNLFEF